jgi:hypothetical protein
MKPCDLSTLSRPTPPANELEGWSLVVAVNDESVLNHTLLASPAIDSRCQVIIQCGFSSAGKAYNAGLAEAQHEIVVFAHQDVYLPDGWVQDLNRALVQLAQDDPDWGVLGVFGVVADEPAELRGHCYSTGLNRILGAPFVRPIPAASLDELVLVVRRLSGLAFDEQLPGFHLYGTDICTEARSRNMRNHIISAFCVHNSNGLKYYPSAYWRSYRYVRNKWRDQLPLVTCCVSISKSYRPMLAQFVADLRKRLFGASQVGRRDKDVPGLYRRIAESMQPAMTAGRLPGRT